MKRSNLILAVTMAALSLPGWAQEKPRFELGVTGGAGGYSYIENTAYTRGVVGVEACAWCSGRYALFGEYTHWMAPGYTYTNYLDADTFGVGLRIQGRRKVRPFFDIGFAAGSSRFGRIRPDTTNSAGVVIGTGVMIPAGKHLYFRPQVRLYPLGSNLHFGASGLVGVGWRF